MQNKTNLLSKEKTTKQNRIWVRIASICNNKCIFCLDSFAQNGTFTEEKIVKKQIKDWLKPWYENRVIISGGEASIDPKFAEYISYAKKVWYDRVQTVTNWNKFADENFCKKVFVAWLEEVTFSFHGHNPILHDYLVDTPWAFKKSLKGLIYIKKYYPKVILNVDIVVNKVNINYLPEIIKFFIKLWIYEFDILQIIPFGRGFTENKEKLFYDINQYKEKLTETWKLSKIPWMYMWTNRFPAEAFEWFEDLIQDPRKMKWEVMWESAHMFKPFIESKWKNKPECFWEACEYCFQKQYCWDILTTPNPSPLEEKGNKKSCPSLSWERERIQDRGLIMEEKNLFILKWEEFPSEVYKKYWNSLEEFKEFLKNTINSSLLKGWVILPSPEGGRLGMGIINLPKCLWWSWIYQTYSEIEPKYTLEDYTKKYITNLYRKKSLRCKKCKYYDKCEGIHINFIRSYGFEILEPIINPSS